MPSNTEEAPVYIDKRGANKTWEPEKVQPVVIDVKTGKVKGEWEDVRYKFAFVPIGQQGQQVQQVLAVRAVGLRKHDQKTCIVDYFLSDQIPSGINLTAEVKKRLDTFLDCDCGAHAPCSLHAANFQMWVRSDIERLELMASLPRGKAMEALDRMEQALAQQSKSNLLIPGQR